MSGPPSISCFKAVLMGESTVGKTALIVRWVTGEFPTDLRPTVGASHQRKRVQVGGCEVDVAVWDTAGQEQFHALMPLYARSSAVAILVADIANPDSFDKLDAWVELLGQSSEPIPPIVLAINKIDLAKNLPDEQEELSERWGTRFAALFFVSALTNDGVDIMFQAAAEIGYRCVKEESERGAANLVVPGDGAREGSCC